MRSASRRAGSHLAHDGRCCSLSKQLSLSRDKLLRSAEKSSLHSAILSHARECGNLCQLICVLCMEVPCQAARAGMLHVRLIPCCLPDLGFHRMRSSVAMQSLALDPSCLWAPGKASVCRDFLLTEILCLESLCFVTRAMLAARDSKQKWSRQLSCTR